MKLFGVGWRKSKTVKVLEIINLIEFYKIVLWKVFSDYAKESSIHGLRFVCEGKCFNG